MIPIRDELPTRRFPYVTVVLIVLNILFFLYELSLGSRLEAFVYQAGLIPAVLWGKVHFWAGLPSYLRIFSSMFLHGGLVHLFFNMLYLWIFGNNVEDFLGHFHFLLFYLGCGTSAALVHAILFPSSTVPVVGASGAIAGVMGGYLVLFPYARVIVLVFLGFFITFIRVPAALLLLLWIFLQIMYGAFSFLLPNAGGVAWFAHIGGFLVGAFWCKMMASRYYYRKFLW